MKKILLVLIVLTIIGGSSLSAADLSLGLTYGADVKEIGIHAGLLFSVMPKLRLGPDLTYYLTPSGLTWLEFNFNAYYTFVAQNALKLYGLAGLQFAYASLDLGPLGSADNLDIGFNIGGGLEYDLGGLSLFAEPKFTIGGFEQLAISFGVRLSL